MAEIGIGVLVKVIEKPIDLLWNLISKPVIVLYNCKNNVENLKNKAVELQNKLQSVEQYEQYVERRGEELGNDLKNWLTDTNLLISETKKVFDVDEVDAKNKCFFGVCFNPVPRYKLSKKAAQNSETIAQQLTKAKEFKTPDSYAPAPVVEVAASAVKGFEEFGSRRGVLEQIMEELQSTAGLRRIGLYGMAGAGKSTMVKEIKRKAEEEKLFEKVVLASVTNNPDLKRILKEIACGLGMDQLREGLEVQNIATIINAKLRKLKTVLVIFDDVWTKFNLGELGVAFDEINSDGHGGEGMKSKNLSSSDTGSSGKEGVNWKILFTSRDRNVLKIEMGTQKEFGIGKLAESEAWQMFKKIAGERVESDHALQPIANGIVEKCDGLPLAISALANALKGRDLHGWRDALSRLQKPSPNNFTGVNKSVYAAIEVSYDQLETEELKQILLLSSMLPKYTTIQYLLMYGAGLGLFPQTNSIGGKRDQLLTLIGDLKAASLFIDGSDDEHFAMHDLVRDVAVSIAHRGHRGLLLKDDYVPNEWYDVEAVKKFKWISVQKATVDGYPVEVESSQLSLLHLSSPKDTSLEILTNFFKGTQRLKVLDMTSMNLSPLPSSICLLKSLQTLCLDWSVVGDMSMIGELKSLEILSLSGSDFEELPREVGQLTRLKLLALSSCDELQVIPPGTLKHLSRLEELYMGNNFDQWELEEHCDQRNSSLVELKNLKSLAILKVRIGDVDMIPRDLIFNSLIRYTILIGDAGSNWESSFHNSRILRLKLHKDRALNLDRSVKKLVFKNTEELHLEDLNGVRNLVDELDEDGFQDLKCLFVRNSPDVEKITNSARNALPTLEVLFLHQLINLEKIFQGRFSETSFLKLREIDVSCCDQLKNLFSSAVANHLPGLQEIRVTECKNMEEILDDKQQGSIAEIVDITERAGELEFGKQLRVLLLKHLPKLSSLNSSRSISLFNDQVVLPNLVELQLSWIDVSVIWETSVISSTCVENLTILIIEGCHNLKYIFTSTMARGLSKLAHLEIKECRRMREVVLTEIIAEEEENLVFPKLSFLLMEDLQSLVGFYSGTCIVEFPSLKKLQILNCPELKGFSINSGGGDDIDHALFNDQVGLPSLESLTISHLKYLTNIWNSRQISATSFCKLKSLEVSWCEKLLMVFSSFEMLERFWTSIEELRIVGCGSLTVVFEIEECSETKKRDVKYSTLRELYLRKLPRLKHVWDKDPQGTLSFQNMELLIIEECQSLIDVFPTSIAKSLSQLQKLILRECGVEEIIAGARGGVNSQEVVEFKFPNLSSIKLVDLTRFKHFYREEKTLIDCPMLRKFDFFSNTRVAKNTGGVLDKLPLYSKEKVISQLENLSLSENDIAMIQEGQFQGDPIFKIKVLRIYGYLDIASAIFPITFIQRFCNMEKLVLQRCCFTELFSPKVVCQVEEPVKHSEIETLPMIKKLKLVSLSDIKHVWSHDSSIALPNLQTLQLLGCPGLISLSTSSATSFQNLTTLTVWHCNKMTHLVSVLIAQSLVQLKHMTVGGCNLLTGVLRNEEEDGTQELIVTFDKLRFLRLHCLTRATSFCSGKSILKFPSLDRVIINQCPQLKIFCEGEIDAPVLCKVELTAGGDKWRWVNNLNATVQRMYEEKVGFIGLQILPLNDFPELIKIWHLQTPSEILNFRSLVQLEVSNCHSFMYLLTPAMALSLIQLRELKVKNCGKLEKVILGDEEQNEIMFPQLYLIRLEDCSGMASFYVGSNSLKLPALLYLVVKSCPKMVTFANVTSSGILEEETPQYFFSNNKVALPTLERLIIESMGSLNKIWEDQLEADAFCVLNYLRVESCEKLLNIFSYSVLKRLQKLDKLRIRNCSSVEEIFEYKGDGASEPHAQSTTVVDAMDFSLVFPNLTHLELYMLPKLKCVSTRVRSIECPLLKLLQVNGCDQVQIFALEYPGFQIPTGDDEQEISPHCPLFWVTKGTFPSLTALKLRWNSKMKDLWCGKDPGSFFPKLMHIELIDFPEQSAQLASFFVQSLPEFCELVVNDVSREISQESKASSSQQVREIQWDQWD